MSLWIICCLFLSLIFIGFVWTRVRYNQNNYREVYKNKEGLQSTVCSTHEMTGFGSRYERIQPRDDRIRPSLCPDLALVMTRSSFCNDRNQLSLRPNPVPLWPDPALVLQDPALITTGVVMTRSDFRYDQIWLLLCLEPALVMPGASSRYDRIRISS